MRMPRVQSVIIASTAVILGAVVALAVQRELAPHSTNAPVGANASPQYALSADEEAYAAALWPIHSGVVEASAVEMSFAGVDYMTEHPDRERLGARVSRLNGVFSKAAAEAHDLAAPPSLRRVHDLYLEALTLYVDASAEMAKVVDDGKVDHLIAANGLSRRAAENLLKVGDVLWPSEHKPN